MKKHAIIQVHQSPMNPHQWCCQLDCGHDKWITADNRPRQSAKKTIVCDRCQEKDHD